MNFSKFVIACLTCACFNDTPYGLRGLLSNKFIQECMGHVDTSFDVKELARQKTRIEIFGAKGVRTSCDTRRSPEVAVNHPTSFRDPFNGLVRGRFL